MLTINVILLQHGHHVIAIMIFANQAYRLKRQARAHFGKREQNIKRRAAGRALAAGNFRQPARFRPFHDLVHMVHQHIARGNHASTFAHYASLLLFLYTCPALPKVRICSATTSVMASSMPSSNSANSSYIGLRSAIRCSTAPSAA